MKGAESKAVEQEVPGTSVGPIQIPAGLLGFEHVKEYVLRRNPQDSPFLRLHMAAAPQYSFLVIEPRQVTDAYEPAWDDAEVAELDLTQPGDAGMLAIVTRHRDGQVTVNLKSPILINRRTRVAKQVVPLNAASYPLQHPWRLAAA